MECLICGRDAVTPFHSDPCLCSAACYKTATADYMRVELEDAGRQAFPLITGINIHAENFGPCRQGDWGEMLAHAHIDTGVICVRGPVDGLFDKRGPTSLLLHEYAHLQVRDGHSDAFWTANKQLHRDYGVMHERKAQAWSTIAGSVLLGGAGLVLWQVFGWGWIAIGPGIAAVLAVPAALNSFRTEQTETHSRECGTEA